MNYPASMLVQVPLRTGLDESIDGASAPPGVLSRLQNGIWNKIGRVEKRDGTSQESVAMIDGSSSPGAIMRLFVRDEELGCTDGTSLFTRSTAGWKTTGRVSDFEATWEPAVDAPGLDSGDCDSDGTYVAITWRVGANIYASIRSLADGSLVLPPTLVDSGSSSNPRIFLTSTSFGSGTVAAVFYMGLSGGLSVRTLTTTAVSAATVLVVAASATIYDICRSAITSGAWIIATSTVGGTAAIATLSAVFAVGAAVSTTALCNNKLSVFSAPEAVYVGVSNNTDDKARVTIHNATTLALLAGPAVVRTVSVGNSFGAIQVTRCNATSCVVAWTESDIATSATHTYSLTVNTGGGINTTTQRTTFFTFITGRLFSLNSRVYMTLSTTRPALVVPNTGASIFQNSAFVVEAETNTLGTQTTSPHRLAAHIAPREASDPSSSSKVAVAIAPGDTEQSAWFVAAIATEPSSKSAGAFASELRLVKLSLTPQDPWRSCNIGHAMPIAGGYAASHDGRCPFEIGFMQPPRVISAAPATTGGSMAAGIYNYSFVYEWIGNDGLLYRSIPSQPQAVTTTGTTGKVTFVLECAGTTGKANVSTGFLGTNSNPVRIVPYRTTVNGATFYRMTVAQANIVLNDPQNASVTWADLTIDTSVDGNGTLLNTRPILYVTGNVLDEVMPPAFTTMIQHHGRLWGVAGDQRTIWYTKKYTDDPTVFPGFNEDLRVVLDDKIVALESLDDKLVVFTMRGVYVVYGDGPDITGGNSDLQDPTLIQGAPPCVTPRSVVQFPGGVAYQSARGIYLLSRDLEVTWLGRPVQDEIPSSALVAAALHVQIKSQIRFAIENVGTVIVFDYENQLWSVFTYPGATESLVIVDDTIFSTLSAIVIFEDPTTNFDFGPFAVQWVTLDIELTLTPSGPIAWQHIRRVQILGARQTSHQLQVRLAFDYADAYAQDFTFNESRVLTNNDCVTMRIGSQNGANPKCKALRIRVTDVAPGNETDPPVLTGKGGWFRAIGLEFVPKPGLPRHGANNAKV